METFCCVKIRMSWNSLCIHLTGLCIKINTHAQVLCSHDPEIDRWERKYKQKRTYSLPFFFLSLLISKRAHGGWVPANY